MAQGLAAQEGHDMPAVVAVDGVAAGGAAAGAVAAGAVDGGDGLLQETTSKETTAQDEPSKETTAKDEASKQTTSKDASSKETAKDGQDEDDNHEYPTGTRRTLVVFGLCLSLFTFSLDETIMSTAIPSISNAFNAIDDIGWYGAAYVISACALQLPMGKLMTLLPLKWVYLASMLIFEVGQVIGGTAQSSLGVIMGRFVSGVGASGIAAGAYTIIADTIPLAKRPMYLSGMSALYTVAAVVGPIIGGALTQHVTWRWVFFVNIPLGGATIIAIAIFLPNDTGRSMRLKTQSLRDVVVGMDLPGSVLLIGAIVSLLLVLQWGGVTYAWSDGRCIALFVVFGVLGALFVAWCAVRKDKALLPPHIMLQRSVAASSWYTLWVGLAMGASLYYLPVYFQAIKGYSPTDSGLLLLGLLLPLILFSMVSGGIITKTGYPAIGCAVEAFVSPVGMGLLTTLRRDSSLGMILGYQIILGAGLGMGAPAPTLLVQAVLPNKDVATGTALIVFWQTLGVALAIAIGQAIFLNNLAAGLQSIIPDITTAQLLQAGATTILDRIPDRLRGMGYTAYENAIHAAFYFSVGAVCATTLSVALMEWKSIKEDKAGKDEEGAAAAKAGDQTADSSDVVQRDS